MGFASPVTIAFGRNATFALLAVVAILVVSSVSLVLEAARVQNDKAADQTRRFAQVLLETRARYISQMVVDYADWGDAYRHLHLTVDPTWAWTENNMGRTLAADLGIESAAVFDAEGRQVYGVLDSTLVSGPVFKGSETEVARLVEQARGLESGEVANAVVIFGEDPVFLVAAAIRKGDDLTISADGAGTSVLVFGDRISAAETAELGVQLDLPSIRFTVFDPSRRPDLVPVLATNNPHRAIAIEATYPRPGTAMIRSLLPWTVGVLLLVGGLSTALARQGVRAARRGSELAVALRQANQQAEHRASHDLLTGLPNRAVFQRAMASALAADAGPLALLYLDLDHFKAVNDTFGHAAGDAVLRETALRLQSLLPASDLCARIGGDEFLILSRLPDEQALQQLARRIIRSISEPIVDDGRRFGIGATVGIAAATAGDDPQTILRRADEALYAAKAAGRGRFHFAPASFAASVPPRQVA